MKQEDTKSIRLVLAFAVIVGALLNLAKPGFAHADATRPNGDLLIQPSDDAVVSLGSVQSGESVTVQLTVQNLDQAAKHSMVGTILNPHLKFLGGHYPGLGGTCAKELDLNQNCTIMLEFAPKTAGVKRLLVRMNYWSGPRPETSYRVLEGVGIQRGASVAVVN